MNLCIPQHDIFVRYGTYGMCEQRILRRTCVRAIYRTHSVKHVNIQVEIEVASRPTYVTF